MKELLIVIVTYNSDKYIKQCLAPLKSIPNNWQIMIIDNKSCDKTINILEDEYKDIILIKNDKNLGFGAANNIGLKYALEHKFEHILLLNADAYISIENISKLIKLQKENPEYYIISPIHYDGSNENLDKSFIEYTKHSNDFIEDAILGKYKKNIYPVPFVNAAIWLLSIQSIKDIGGFSPTFFHYGEDFNYTNRVLFHKKLCGISPLVKGVHDRANRPLNPLYEEQLKIKYRTITIELSNPNLVFRKTLCKFFKLNIKKFYKIQNVIMMFKLIKNLKVIYKNLIISKKTNTCFIFNTEKKDL